MVPPLLRRKALRYRKDRPLAEALAMRPTPALCLILLLALAECSPAERTSSSDSARSNAAPSSLAARAGEKPPAPGVKLAYSHQLDLQMPPAAVEPRFMRARAACLEDPAFTCLLLGANLRGGAGYPQADLTLRLPHGQIDAFEARVLAPLPDEAPDTIEIVSRSTEAEDLSQAMLDVERRLNQRAQYRDRLLELAKRSDAKVEDLIKVESELATVQSEIEALSAQQQHLNDQVATEKLTIAFASRQSLVAQENPIVEVWHESAGIFSRNVADALRAMIMTLPWLVPIVLLIQVIRFLWRFLRRRDGTKRTAAR
jgi:hypothetical protein